MVHPFFLFQFQKTIWGSYFFLTFFFLLLCFQSPPIFVFLSTHSHPSSPYLSVSSFIYLLFSFKPPPLFSFTYSICRSITNFLLQYNHVRFPLPLVFSFFALSLSRLGPHFLIYFVPQKLSYFRLHLYPLHLHVVQVLHFLIFP